MNFYKTTFTIMIVVLIICLAIIGTTIAYSNDGVKFPPITSECPDYYKKNESDSCVLQVTDITSKSGCDNVDFNDINIFPNKDNGGIGPASALCEKKQWAKGCKVNWDGITTNDNICYSTIN
jgi:hypothetical protein